MPEARSYDILDLSGTVRKDGIRMWVDGDGEGDLTIGGPTPPGEIPAEEPVVMVSLERDTDDASASMCGFVPVSEFSKIVEFAEGFE